MNCKSYTISILRVHFIILPSNSYSQICIKFILFPRFSDSSSFDKDEELAAMATGEESAAVARGVGKLNGDETEDEENLYAEDDKDVRSVGKKSDEISGFVGVTSIVGGHVGQNHNPLRDNVRSNFAGFTSHLALNYDPPFGPFCEYVVCTNLFFCCCEFVFNN
jgi:hypothetical protein